MLYYRAHTMRVGARPAEGLRDLDLRTLAAPESAALIGSGQNSFSFLQCAEAAEGIAQKLQEAGIRSSDVVALAVPDAESLLLGVLGVSRVAAAAPVDGKLAERELQSRLLLLNPRALVTAVDADPKLLRAAEGAGVPVFSLRFLPPTKRRVRSVASDVAAVLQTSATTGAPKMAPLTEGNLSAMIANVQRAFDLQTNDRLLCFMPPHHLGGLLSCLAQLFAGGTVICSSAPGDFIELLGRHRPTWYLAGPAMHRAILRAAQEKPDGLRRNSLRFIRSGSAAITPDLIEALEAAFEAPVIHGYGMTEAGVITSTGSTEKGCVGKSIGVEIGIVNAEGLILPAATEGEIVLRGDAVISGYLDDRDANRTAFTEGWFRTGDLGRLNRSGELFITGRLREMINRGGEKILPDEIDCALAEHPSVQAAAAFAVAHPTLGEDVAAAVVLRAGVSPDELELATHMASRLGPARLPSHIFFVDEIPVGETGKPRRHQLARSFARTAEMHSPMATEGLVERQIAEVWARVLGRSVLPGKNESFFAIGGDSLAWARMTAMLESEMGVDVRLLAPPLLLASPTITVLTDVVRQHRTVCKSPRVDAVVLDGRDGRPFYCFPGAALDATYLRPLARLLGQPFIVLRDTRWDPTAGPAAFEELIQGFVDYVIQTQPPGAMGGHCFGGILAFECARRLEALGWPVPLVVLFDTEAPGYPKASRHWRRYLRWVPEFALKIRAGSAARAGTTPFTDAVAVHMRSYVPRPFGGRVVSFMAGDRPVTSRVLEDARLGWRDFARSGFESHLVAGDHDSMFSEEQVPGMAELLRGVLLRNRI